MSRFDVTQLDDGKLLGEENILPTTVGLAVDYLSRWSMTGDLDSAFHVSILGARRVDREKEAVKLLNGIKDMSDTSITNACKLVPFDTFARGAFIDLDTSLINPDHQTCENIRIMVDRTKGFFSRYGPITLEGFDLMGGYSRTVDRGSGDYLTKDTLWDMKVSRKNPESKHTLQLLMYYIMGKRSIHEEFRTVDKVGFFNPRLNKLYVADMSAVDPLTIKTVEEEVICYKSDEEGFNKQLSILLGIDP